MVVGENKRTANIMDGIENTGDVRLHDHRLRLKQRFDIVRKLGQGTYGKVQLGINKKTGQEVAIKTIKKCKIESEADLIRIRREVQIMSSVRHPNIVHIYEVFENSEKMILVMEYCSGGELYDYLSQKKVLEEEEARRLFRQIATAVYYCHIHKICHRDLKLENVLLDDTGSAKIADFGLSNVFKETSLLSTFCGSPLYASPEIVKGTPYIGPEVDCWSLGVLLYTLVYGAMPFDGSNFKRLVRQISNGDYYEPKSPSTASPLIRDMLTVDPLKRADIAYICDHPWVNTGCQTSCLEVAEALAAETPVRLDLLLSLAPAAPSNSNSVVVPSEAELGPEESCTDLTSSTSMAVEPSNSAEKRILELVAEGGEDAIKPSPTRTIVSASDNKRKLELAMSASGLQRKKERVASCASIAPQTPLPEESNESTLDELSTDTETSVQPCLKSSATITIAPAPGHTSAPAPAPAVTPAPTALVKDATKEIVKESPKEESKEKPGMKPRVTVKKKASPSVTSDEKSATEKQEDVKLEELKPASVASAADKLTSLSLAQQPTANQTGKPKIQKIQIPGGNVGSFKEQFERRASLTTSPEIKRNVSKSVVSKIAKPKAQSEDRELSTKTPDNGTVRLQQIGIEPSLTPVEDLNHSGVKKTESEPTHSTTAVDPSVLLQDARRSLQNSMAKLVEEKVGEESRRRAARDIISTAIRTGKPPMAYGRSSSAGVTALSSLSSPPGTPPAAPATAPAGAGVGPRLFRTEAQHRVEDHRNRGVSVERIIPIHVAGEEAAAASPPPQQKPAAAATPTPTPTPAPTPAPRANQVPLRRMLSSESGGSASESCSSPGEPIKKSAREFIIPIAVEGKGYVTPRQRSLEPDVPAAAARLARAAKPRRLSSLVSGGESEEEDDAHMHRLRSTRAARAESVSSGEEDEEDEDFHLLTAENLFSTLLHRVRALTQRLNGEEGPGFPQHPHSLFNNLHQSPFFNSPHLPRRHLLREGWGGRDLHADFDSMFNKSRQAMPRGNSKKSSKHHTKPQQNPEPNVETKLDLSDLDLSSIQFSEKEMKALSGLTPALSRRLQQQLLAHLPPAAARSLRRTLSLHAAAPPRRAAPARSLSACKPSPPAVAPDTPSATATGTAPAPDTPPATATAPAPDTSTATAVAAAPDTPPTTAVAAAPDTPPTTAVAAAPDTPPAAVVASAPDTLPAAAATACENTESPVKDDSMDVSTPQFSTLPRPKRYSTLSRESTPPNTTATDVGYDYTPKMGTLAKELSHSRGSSIRSTPDRPLLSKYLTPDRNLSLDESYSSDGGSILSEPSYIAAYGPPAIGSLGFRRHSMRLSGDQPRKRISRFLRPDFFDTPPDESLYAKHKKEKELETQKILKEIREKRNKALESSVKSPTESSDVQQMFKDDGSYPRKCLSPIGILTGKDRSRSNTPFFPILDNIKETTLDTSLKIPSSKFNSDSIDTKLKTKCDDSLSISKESKLTRPKSYPVKDSFDEIDQNSVIKEMDYKEKSLPRESKLIRPKSYPASSPSPEKVYVNRNVKKDEVKINHLKDEVKVNRLKDDVKINELKDEIKINETKDEIKINKVKDEVKINMLKDDSKINQLKDEVKTNQLKDKVKNNNLKDDVKISELKHDVELSNNSEINQLKDEVKMKQLRDEVKINQSTEVSPNDKNNVEVSFSINLPRKKPLSLYKAEANKNSESKDRKTVSKCENNKEIIDNSLNLKKYQVVDSNNTNEKTETSEKKGDTSLTAATDTTLKDSITITTSNIDAKSKSINQDNKKEDVKLKRSTDLEPGEKKGTIKKKIIKKVSSKSKTDVGSSLEANVKNPTEKKKVTKKVKDKLAEDGMKPTSVTKKKSVLQSIGHKLEKLASSKSGSPDKLIENNSVVGDTKKEASNNSRMQREQSVPVNTDPPTESNLIKRAVTLTDVAALDNQISTPSKTTVSKVLGLFKKFEPKEKTAKIEKSQSVDVDTESIDSKIEPIIESISESPDNEKPKRPTSLLLNGLGRKNKYERTASDSVAVLSRDNATVLSKKENESKNLKNTLKLDFSRLPRVKKIVPTNPVIEPQIINITPVDKETEKKDLEKNTTISDGDTHGCTETVNRERSRSRSTYSNSDSKSEPVTDVKDKNPLSPSETITHHPLRNHESTTPEKEDIVDRIRRKSFYSRFNEKKQRRKSSLVGPGATEYDPVARLHSQPTETKYDVSPTSPATYDLSPGFSVMSDLSPSTERYRSLLTDLPTTTRSNVRFDNYGINDKIDTYRSLDRGDFRKYPISRSYLDYDQPSTYSTPRYSRTKSLLDSSDVMEDHSLGLRDPHKYNRTLSMYSPGSYATYRPKKTRNSAIILKESEKEPSPENILDKIRQRKKLSVNENRKSEPEKELLARSNVTPKGESDGAERSEKVD